MNCADCFDLIVMGSVGGLFIGVAVMALIFHGHQPAPHIDAQARPPYEESE